MLPESLKILIVEDNPADRVLYKIYLKQSASCEIAEADRGATGLALCHSWRPDCILLDFSLPDFNGIEFLTRLRAQFGGLPCAVVMLTGVADERVAVKAVTGGATDYLPKSDKMEGVLEHAISNAIEKHRLEKELEQKRLQLARSEHLHRSLLKALPQLVWTSDGEGRIGFANNQWWEYIGVDESQPEKVAWPTVLHPDDFDRWWRIWRARTSADNSFGTEARLRRAKDQQYRWHLVSVVRLDKIQQLDGIQDAQWLGTCTDVEDSKRAEQALLQRQKWDSVGLLAGGIAHDFNNLLVGILGGASYVADALPSTHPTQPVLQNVITSGQRAAHLTRQLLAYAGKGAFFIEQVDLSALVTESCHLIHFSVPKNVRLETQLQSDLPKIESDAGQIQQVVMNLMLNAVEAIPDGEPGVVTVRTFARAEDSRRSVGLEVHDTGRGMDSETKARIFDPFFTTKFTGRGLGLAAVQGIVRSSGSSIDVETALHEGSKFTVTFNSSSASANPNAVPDQPARTEAPAPKERATQVLVIDDEKAVRQICKTALERLGYSVLLAQNGADALHFLESGQTVDLILLDRKMPVTDGRGVLTLIRSRGYSTPVLVFSGMGENEARQDFDGLEISGFLQKPFSAATLTAHVAQVLVSSQIAERPNLRS